MSNLGNQELGDIILGGEGDSEEPSFSGLLGQAQAWIEVVTNSFAQSQAQIKQTYYSSAQAQATLATKQNVHAQSQALILAISNTHGQAQALLSATYFAVAQAQAYILLNAGHGQAQGQILQTYYALGQSQVFIIGPTPALGQAQAWIAKRVVYDTFSRVTTNGQLYGTPDVGPAYVHNGAQTEYDFSHLDGSVLTITESAYTYLDAHLPVNINDVAAQIDFRFVGSVSENASIIELDTRFNQFGKVGLYAYIDGGVIRWEMYGFNSAVGESFGTFQFGLTPVAGTWYTAKLLIHNRDARGKIWERGTQEPDWQQTVLGFPTTVQSGPFDFYADVGDGISVTQEYDNLEVFKLEETPENQRFGQARALLITSFGFKYAQANARIKGIGVTKSGQAQATIFPLGLPLAYAQAQAKIKAIDVSKHGQAQALIRHVKAYAQSAARIRATYNSFAQARGFVINRRRWFGQARASIRYGGGTVSAQARAYIHQPLVYGQARAFIFHTQGRGQALARIIGLGNKHGQGRAFIALRAGKSSAQAQARIKKTTRFHGLVKAQIVKPFFSQHGQARAVIKYPSSAFGNARAYISKPQQNAQAQAQIVVFGGRVYAQSQAQIRATVTLGALGQSQAIIRGPAAAQAAALIYSTMYLVRYNGYNLPGYAQEETIDSITRVKINGAVYIDGSLSQYTGLENKKLSLRMKVVGRTYGDVKLQTQRATTILRSRREFTKLYLQHWDRYYEALVTRVSTGKQVRESQRSMDYSVEFETKPWLLSDKLYSITGTGLISTSTRTIEDGGWTPTRIIVDGTNITISGYTAAGAFAGYATIQGTVSNFVIDSNTYTSSDNSVMGNADYVVFVGPGKTYYQIDGATSCTIEWRNRWYL